MTQPVSDGIVIFRGGNLSHICENPTLKLRGKDSCIFVSEVGKALIKVEKSPTHKGHDR